MGYSVRVHPEHRLGVVHLTGEVGGGDVLRAIAALLGDPSWEPAFDAVWDCRPIVVLDLEPSDLRHVVGLLGSERGRLGTGRRALVMRRVMEGDVARLMSRMAGREAVREFRTFFRADEAATWLGFPAGLLGPT
jgi:hypothetical protein